MTGTVRPTKKQQELLVYIEQFIGEHGYSPSYREIMNGCQYNSVATVALHVGNLIKRGHLRKRDHSARSLEVVKDKDLPGLAQYNLGGPGDPGSLDNSSGKPDTAPATGGNWLLQQAERLISRAEQRPSSTDSELENIRAVLRTCSVLGVEAQAQELIARFAALEKTRQTGLME